MDHAMDASTKSVDNKTSIMATADQLHGHWLVVLLDRVVVVMVLPRGGNGRLVCLCREAMQQRQMLVLVLSRVCHVLVPVV